MQSRENAQVRIGELPTFRLPSGRSSSSDNGAEVFAAGHGAKVLSADSRQAGYFILCENLLGRFNSDHPLPSFASTMTIRYRQKWN